MYALLRYSYIKEILSLHTTDVELSKDAEALILEDKKLFRKKCGDSYVFEETLGASLYVVFEASSNADLEFEDVKFETLFEVIVAGAAQGKINPRYEKSVEKFWENTDVSLNCFHIGGEADVCTAAQLEDINIYGEEAIFRQKLAQTKDFLAQDVKNNELLGTINRKFKNYPIDTSESIFEKYFDYRNNNESISDWEFLKQRIEKATNGLPWFELELRDLQKNT